jgi:hypothetical protein
LCLDSEKQTCWNFAAPVENPGYDSNTCNADSGGPLLFERTTGIPPEIVGVTSGGAQKTCLAEDHSYDASVYYYRDWILKEAGADLGAVVGTLPAVGDQRVAVQYANGRLDATNPAFRSSFTIREGIGVVRITMNAEDHKDARNDFNLYVRRGGPAGPGEAECAADDRRQFGFCEFSQPAAGVWHFSIVRQKGAGAFQIVVTTFRP